TPTGRGRGPGSGHFFFFFQAEDGIRDLIVTGVQTCALPISVADYFRGHLWPNTPDILHATLQQGGRPAFKLRLVLAATLSSLYGIYSGYELCENPPAAPGSEEYLDSEKYELKRRDWKAPGNLVDFVSRVNRIRRENRALHLYTNLRFY